MNKKYVSPVCHLIEVVTQMSICGVSGGEEAPIIDPNNTPNPKPTIPLAPKTV